VLEALALALFVVLVEGLMAGERQERRRAVALWGLLSPRRRVLVYRIQKLRKGHQVLPVSGRRRALPVGGGPRNPDWFREDFRALLELLRQGKVHPVVAERLPLSDARHAHELLESSADKGKLVLVPLADEHARLDSRP
jgi:NADPH2:quinone reductase